MVSPPQVRAARALLNWTQADLASASKIAVRTIQQFEVEGSAPYRQTVEALQTSLEAAGVSFFATDVGEGVLLRHADAD